MTHKYTAAALLLFPPAAFQVPVLFLAFSTLALPILVAIVLWSALGLDFSREPGQVV